MRSFERTSRWLTAFTITALISAPALAQGDSGQSSGQPFKLGVEEKNQLQQPADYGYPAPQMVPGPPPRVAPIKPPKKNPPMKANIEASPPPRPMPPPQPQRPPMAAAVQQNTLPQQFLGNWRVMSQRTSVKGSTPEFQSGYERVFAPSRQNQWNITGRPGAYGIASDAGMQEIQLGQITGDTAFFRYQHPVYMRNEQGQMVPMPTIAQEAVVMQASPDGRSFTGKLRITLVKPGEPPRGQVSYDLMGQR
jgi:hypothetical protein